MRSPASDASIPSEVPTSVRSLLLLFLLLASAGCGRMLASGDWDPFRSSGDRRLSVTVVNEHFTTVTVTALAPGRRTRLGSVEVRARNGFSIPWSAQGDVRFLLEISGGQSYTTPPVVAGAGQSVEIWVRNPLRQSVVRR